MTTRRTKLTIGLIVLIVVVTFITTDQCRRDQRRNQPRPLVSASPQSSPAPLPLVSTPPSPKVAVQRPQRAVTATVATTSPTPDPSIAYNAARLVRGLTSRVYFGGEQGPNGVVATGTMLIVHPDGSREQFACMKPVPCEKCKVIAITYVQDLTCDVAREKYR